MALGLGILRLGQLLELEVVSSWEVRAAWGQVAPPQRLRHPHALDYVGIRVDLHPVSLPERRLRRFLSRGRPDVPRFACEPGGEHRRPRAARGDPGTGPVGQLRTRQPAAAAESR